MPEFIDPVFAKTSTKRLFSVIEKVHVVLVVAKTGSINSDTGNGGGGGGGLEGLIKIFST